MIARYWLRWWIGRAGVGPYRRDALRWWLTGGPLRDSRAQLTPMALLRRDLARAEETR